MKANRTGKEFPVPGGTPFLGLQSPGQIDLAEDRSQTSRFFGWVHYKAVGTLTAAFDYALIVTASIVAGVGYHAVILQGDVPDLMPYVAAGNIVAALFVLGAASRRHYTPGALVSARRQVRSVMLFWPLAFLSLALFLFLAKSGPDFSRGTIIAFGALGFVSLLSFHVWLSAALKSALARGAIAGDRAVTIGDRANTRRHRSRLAVPVISSVSGTRSPSGGNRRRAPIERASQESPRRTRNRPRWIAPLRA